MVWSKSRRGELGRDVGGFAKLVLGIPGGDDLGQGTGSGRPTQSVKRFRSLGTGEVGGWRRYAGAAGTGILNGGIGKVTGP